VYIINIKGSKWRNERRVRPSRGIVANYLVFLIFASIGAAVAGGNGLLPPLWSIPRWATSLVGGAVAGGVLAYLMRIGLRRVRILLNRPEVEVCLINSFIFGISATVFGLVIVFSLDLIFTAGVGVRITQGIILAGGMLFGIYAGYRLKVPLLGVDRGKRNLSLRPFNRGGKETKVLDTSAIIDGRIGDLIRTGFIEGEIMVPEFNLGELHNIADSSNNLRRRKGRRGLNALNALMENNRVDINLSSRDYPYIKEVDRKLIQLVKELDGSLVTTDYNLNRVAQVAGVKILNINELANAVKPRFIPGEEIEVEVIDRGEEIGQGVGYLDDGTMVVVENGRRHIGRRIKAIVKSTLQTEAGRMMVV
jgi:uncharacterized protein YacL